MKRVLLLAALALPFASNLDRAMADPPPCTNPQCINGVFCFRITDIVRDNSDTELDRFEFSFEILNWTDQEVFGLSMAINTGTTSSVDVAPFFFSAVTDANGRPIGAGDDDLNFPPADGEAGAKTGQANSWGIVTQTASLVHYTEPTLTVGNGLDERDLIGAASGAAACALIPTCVGTAVTSPEGPDNGGPGVDGGVDNVLDGFVISVDDLDIGDVLSINWFLLDAAGNPIGVSGTGNAYAFGTFNFFASDTTLPGVGPPVWQRAPGAPEGPGANTGTTNNLGDMLVNNDGFGQNFGVEAGGAMTGAFLNGGDNIHGAPINAILISGVPGVSRWVVVVLGMMLALVGVVVVRGRRGEAGVA